ncbi:MAG: 3-phosphoglycerate dehydrogenase [Arenicellales bacterium]
MNILIADSFPESHSAVLEQMGHTCTPSPALDTDSLPGEIADHDVLIVRSTKVNADTLDAGNKLKLVIRAGAGTNTIDKQHANEKGIRVCNVPGANAVAVAELAMGLIIAIDRHIASNVSDLKQQHWNKKKYSTARGLYGQKLGILGLGAIGMALAERARAFGMEVYGVTRPNRSEPARKRIADAGIKELKTFEQVAATCDIISLHLPATDDTRSMINREYLEQMKDGAILINTSRGELIDESALIEAMDNKGIRAGLDVYASEPASAQCEFDCVVGRHPNVVGTHHIGASTTQAQTAVADGVIEIVKAFENGEILNCVNA